MQTRDETPALNKVIILLFSADLMLRIAKAPNAISSHPSIQRKPTWKSHSECDVGIGGDIFVPKIPSYKVIDVARAIDPKAKIDFIGIRPGEKIHEEMITASDSINTIEFDSYYSIIPNNQFVDVKKRKLFLKSGKKCKIGFSYNSLSNKNYLSIKQLRNLIIKNVPESKKIL